MIQRLSHVTFYVTDQDVAKKFYVDKLGFEVRTDALLGTFRWLTVSPKSQPDLEIVLMQIGGSNMDAETTELLQKLAKKAKSSTGVFLTSDCHATYEELKAKGVAFDAPPKAEFYGIATMMTDDFGNRFSLTQPNSK